MVIKMLVDMIVSLESISVEIESNQLEVVESIIVVGIEEFVVIEDIDYTIDIDSIEECSEIVEFAEIGKFVVVVGVVDIDIVQVVYIVDNFQEHHK